MAATRRGRRRPRLLLGHLGLALTLVAGGAQPARAQTNPSLPPATPGPPPPGAPPLEPALAPPGADEAGRQKAAAELKAAEAALRKAQGTAKKASQSIPPLRQRLAEAEAQGAALTDDERRLTDELAAARERVRRLAVEGYVQGGDLAPFNYLLEAEDPGDLLRRRVLVKSATEARHASMVQLEEAKQAVTERLAQVVKAAEDARSALRQAESEAAGQAAVAKQLAEEVEHRRRLLDLVTAAAPVPPSDIPRLFLDAYRQAAAALAKRTPGCRVEWAALAGIGKIESNHGRYRGARLALNGDVYPRIVGIPLDGTRSRLIVDSDGGKLDQDTEFDRAVGPMQFIPSTWKRIEQDGNRDGVKDPNNAYDATLGAAAYLCRAVPTGGIDADEALRLAFFSYNRSEAYVETVLSWTHIYRQMAAGGLT